MLDQKELMKELRRLMQLPFAPADEDGRKSIKAEWIRVMNRDARSNAHVHAVVEHLMDTAQRIPTAADLVCACADVAAPETQKAPLGCKICNGSGWQSFSKMAYPWLQKLADGTVVGNPEGYMADFADYCICDLGRWKKRRAEEEREKKREKRAAA